VMGIKLLLSVHRGEWAAADEYWEKYEAIAGKASSALNVVARRARALQAYLQGDPEEAYRRVSGSDPLYNSPLRAYLLLELGREEEALQLWQMILTRLSPAGHGGLWLLFALPTVAGLREMKSLPEPEAWYAALNEHGSWQPDWLIPAVELARLAADGAGNDDPVEVLRPAVRRYEEASFAPVAAVCRLEAARALVERGRAGDKSRAISEAEAASTEFQRLGMKTFAAEADRLLRRLRIGRPPVDPSRDGLSPREVEVLELVALGMTNSEIADKLSLSPRTVESHIGNILCKLQVSDRTRAAVVAVERGLVRRTGIRLSGEVSLDVRGRNVRARRRHRQN
jgi:DNA-binding NarL/FixJ family response regulator